MKHFLLLLFFLAAAVEAHAASAAGAAFLKNSGGARGQAMGDAVAANVSGAQALFWNPAGLAFSAGGDLFLSVAPAVESIRHQHMDINLMADHVYVAGGYQGVHYGSLDKTDEFGDSMGSFQASDQVFILALAKRFSASQWGVSGKYVRSSIDNISATATTFDAGVMTENPFLLTLRHGLAVKNVGGSLRFLNETTPLPLSVVLGNSLLWGARIRFNADARWVRDDGVSVGAGVETAAVKTAALSAFLRAGYNTARNDIDKLSGASFGGGLSLSSIDLDYAWVPFGNLGSTHAMTLTWRIK